MSTSTSSVFKIDNNLRLPTPVQGNKFGVGKMVARLTERETKEIKGRKSSVPNNVVGSTSQRSEENTRANILDLERGGRDDGESSARKARQWIRAVAGAGGGGGSAAAAGGGGGAGGVNTSDVSFHKLISLWSLVNGAYACLIPLLFDVVQAEYRDPSPFRARPKTMWAFLLGAISFYIAFAASITFSHSEYLLYIVLVVMVAGSLTGVSLISALLPSLIALTLFVIWGIIFIVVVTVCLIKSACPGIYNWIVETLRKTTSACCNWIMDTFCTISSACRQCLSCDSEEKEEKPWPAV